MIYGTTYDAYGESILGAVNVSILGNGTYWYNTTSDTSYGAYQSQWYYINNTITVYAEKTEYNHIPILLDFGGLVW